MSLSPANALPAVAGDDLSLARRCVEGDPRAQRELFRCHRDRVQAMLYRILGSNQEMEDLVQEVFWEVFRSLHRFRGDAKLSTWIARIATRVTFAHLANRRPAPQPLDDVIDTYGAAAGTEEQLDARHAAKRLYRALERMEAKQRIAFTLFAIDGCSLKEVSDLMSASLVATKTRVWRARRFLEARAKKDPVLAGFLAEGSAKGADAEADGQD